MTSMASPGQAPTSGCPVTGFDPFADTFQRDPATTLREDGPVFYSEALGWYVVTGFEDVRAIFSDTQSFSSQIFAEPITPISEAAAARLATHGFEPVRTLGTLDEPIHMQRRRRIAEPYSAGRVAAWEDRIREVYTDCIDHIVGAGRADLVRDVFWEAPAVVAIEFMGVPEADVAEVKGFAASVMSFVFGRPTEEEQIETCELMGRHHEYARDLITRMLDDPSGEGVLQHAVRAHRAEPDVVDESFLVSLAVNTLAAAHETTSSSLANALLLLLTQRSAWQRLCASPDLIPNAVEETLRLVPSLTTNRRLCVRETTIGGVTIPAGAKVLLGVASANRDPALFHDPDRLDLTRRNAKRHMTFGYASHHCLGAPLARLQMRVALEELTRRLPDMRLVAGQELHYLPTASAWSPSSLEVEWDTGEAA